MKLLSFRFPFAHKLSKFQCGFRKGFSAQHCLIYMIEKWKKSLDKKGVAGALLSKAFDYLNHGLLIAKLEAYGVGHPSLHLINSYLSKGKPHGTMGVEKKLKSYC